MRRIISEDPNWTITTVPKLSFLCLQGIVKEFADHPKYEELIPKQKEFVQERLSTSLPLDVSSSHVPDGPFWRRCCMERWNFCDVSDYDYSWKRMYFERHLENIVELFIPNLTAPKTIADVVPICKDHVVRLRISQLLVPVLEPQKSDDEEDDFVSSKSNQAMDHFNFRTLLPKMTCLEELHLVYRVKHCGMNFDWNMFEVTDKDAKNLGKAIKDCRSLKVFKLHQSHLDDRKCELMLQYMEDHPSLKEIDFSHNKIGDEGVKAICHLLINSTLGSLKLSNNNITCQGAKIIAEALMKNSTLESLNLALNAIADEGALAICDVLLSKPSLVNLNLSGNYLTLTTAEVMSQVLMENKTIKGINLSCNKIGEAGGEVLLEALSLNPQINECNVHLALVDEPRTSHINEILWSNQIAELKKEAQLTTGSRFNPLDLLS